MKVTHHSTMRTSPNRSISLRDVLRMIGAMLGWPLLVMTTLVTGYAMSWILYALIRLGRVAAIGDVLPTLLVFLLCTVGLAWLVGRFVASARTVGRVILTTLGLLLILGVIWTVAYPDQSLFWARQVAWGDSTMKDYELYPERPV